MLENVLDGTEIVFQETGSQTYDWPEALPIHWYAIAQIPAAHIRFTPCISDYSGGGIVVD
jgi:hypothetical protein